MAYANNLRASAKRTLISECGGVTNIAYDCVAAMSVRDTLYNGCYRYVRENVLIYRADRRAWFVRRGRDQSHQDIDDRFNGLFASACYDIVTEYMKKHGLSLTRKGNGYVLVKTGPMKLKTTKRR